MPLIVNFYESDIESGRERKGRKNTAFFESFKKPSTYTQAASGPLPSRGWQRQRFTGGSHRPAGNRWVVRGAPVVTVPSRT